MSGGARMAHLDPGAIEATRNALANALQTVFLVGPPLMAIALVAAVLLRDDERTPHVARENEDDRP